jgi:hypothetical protein
MEGFSRAKCNRQKKKNRKLRRDVHLKLDVSMLNPIFMHSLMGTYGWHARFGLPSSESSEPSSKDTEAKLLPSSKESEFVPSSRDTKAKLSSSRESEFVPSSKDTEAKLSPSSKNTVAKLFSSKASEFAPSSKNTQAKLKPSSKNRSAKTVPAASDRDDIHAGLVRMHICRALDGIKNPLHVNDLINEVASLNQAQTLFVEGLLQEVLEEGEIVCVASHIYFVEDTEAR